MGNAQKKLKRGPGAREGSKKNRNDNKQSLASQHSDAMTEENVEVLLKKGPITDYYEVDYEVVLGRGHYATVNLGKDKRTGLQVAIKRIQISKSRVEALKREVEVLRKVGRHPNIVTLYDIFITDTELILVLELLLGGELFDRMVDKGPYSEREASHHVRKIGQALKFLHRAGIVHRDLKPENLILAHKGDNSELKIADFGLANIVDNTENATMKTVCGTWAYCAPEVKTTMTEEGGPACYTAKVDLWSVGVILFVILGAYHPFDADGDASDAQLWSNICSGQFDFEDPAWDHISAGAKDLIRKLIVVNPEERYGTDELLAHPWIRQAASVPATPITPNINKSLIDYNDKRKSRNSFIGKVKRMNPLGGGNHHHQNHQNNYGASNRSSSPTSVGSSEGTQVPGLGTQQITEQDVLEQRRILEEQMHAEAKQRLQQVHYEQQQQLKQRQQQQHQVLIQQQQQHQQAQLTHMREQGFEATYQDQMLAQLQHQYHDQQAQLQQQFQQEQHQLLAQQQREQHLLVTRQVEQAPANDAQEHQHQRREEAPRASVRFADSDAHSGSSSQTELEETPAAPGGATESAMESRAGGRAPSASAMEDADDCDTDMPPPLPQLTLNTLLPRGDEERDAGGPGSGAGGMMEVDGSSM